MWATGAVVCSPVYRILTTCCPIRRSQPANNRYQHTQATGVKSLSPNGLPPFTSQTISVQPQADDFEDPYNFGELHFRLDYDFAQSKLAVTIIEARGLPAMDRNGMSDPYVKLSIFPERKQKYETKIIRNTLNPVYNETFLFSIPFNELQSKTLSLVVFDYDRLSKDDKMGQLAVPLDAVDFGTTNDLVRRLAKPENDDDKESRLGDICFSTRYRPATGTVTLTIMEARNLKKMDLGGTSEHRDADSARQAPGPCQAERPREGLPCQLDRAGMLPPRLHYKSYHHCFQVDFKKIGWKFILAPERYNAFICRGDCRLNHHHLTRVGHTKVVREGAVDVDGRPQVVPPSCCHPSDYESVKVMFVNGDHQVTVIRVPGMIARRCSCS